MTRVPRSPRSGRPVRYEPLLRPGETCEGLYPASRAALLVDGEAYFGALAATMEKARRRILLIGWDFHTGIRLRRSSRGPWKQRAGDAPDLVGTLESHLEARPELEIYVLEWDFALVYAVERQLLPRVRFGIRTHPRLHFALDDRHPAGAAHHQKLVVVDDAVAFTGGFDFAPTRWDTRDHAPDDARRCDPGAPFYPPFHDVGIAVEGEAARALGEIARERWRRATGEALEPLQAQSDPWPDALEPDFEDVDVGVARTDPRHEPPRREIEALYVASLREARRTVYIENQYLTSEVFAAALAERLREPEAPEVVLVGPRRCAGWLEEAVMGARRTRLVERLRAADRHGRLRVLHPVLPGVEDEAIRVHAKLMVVDDRLLHLGSANLSNRSMGLDTELDVAIEAATADDSVARRIEALRNDLLAEHLGCSPERVEQAVREAGGLGRGVDALQGGERTLATLPRPSAEYLADIEAWLPEETLLDPEGPIDVDALANRFLPDPPRSEAQRRGRGWLATALLALALLALLWRMTPLEQYARPEALVGLVEPLRQSPWGAWLFAAGMILGGLVMLPVTAMIVASALTFGPLLGFWVAWAGAMGSALVGYGLGRMLGRPLLERLRSPRLKRLSRGLGRRGLLAVATFRVVPVAPYTVVNLVAGASHVRLRDYALGTLLAMTPGILALTLFSDRVAAAVRRPTAGTLFVALALGLVLWFGTGWARRLLERRRAA